MSASKTDKVQCCLSSASLRYEHHYGQISLNEQDVDIDD